jgi:hypothetical protein
MTMQVLRYVVELLTERLQEDVSKIEFVGKLLQYLVLAGRTCTWINSPWLVGRALTFYAGSNAGCLQKFPIKKRDAVNGFLLSYPPW